MDIIESLYINSYLNINFEFNNMPISSLRNIKEAIANNLLEGLSVNKELLAKLEEALENPAITTTDLIKQFVN